MSSKEAGDTGFYSGPLPLFLARQGLLRPGKTSGSDRIKNVREQLTSAQQALALALAMNLFTDESKGTLSNPHETWSVVSRFLKSYDDQFRLGLDDIPGMGRRSATMRHAVDMCLAWLRYREEHVVHLKPMLVTERFFLMQSRTGNMVLIYLKLPNGKPLRAPDGTFYWSTDPTSDDSGPCSVAIRHLKWPTEGELFYEYSKALSSAGVIALDEVHPSKVELPGIQEQPFGQKYHRFYTFSPEARFLTEQFGVIVTSHGNQIARRKLFFVADESLMRIAILG